VRSFPTVEVDTPTVVVLSVCFVLVALLVSKAIKNRFSRTQKLKKNGERDETANVEQGAQEEDFICPVPGALLSSSMIRRRECRDLSHQQHG